MIASFGVIFGNLNPKALAINPKVKAFGPLDHLFTTTDFGITASGTIILAM